MGQAEVRHERAKEAIRWETRAGKLRTSLKRGRFSSYSSPNGKASCLAVEGCFNSFPRPALGASALYAYIFIAFFFGCEMCNFGSFSFEPHLKCAWIRCDAWEP